MARRQAEDAVVSGWQMTALPAVAKRNIVIDSVGTDNLVGFASYDLGIESF